MCKQENLKKINDIRRRCGETQFRVSIQHLFDTGHQNFNEKQVAEEKAEIQKTTPSNAIMTADFQCELLDRCLELSRLPIWDVLLYVKLYLSMDGDNTLLYEEAERALRAWHTEFGPESWRDVCKNPELRGEVLQEMVEQHKDEFSATEIKSAVRSVVDAL